MPEGDTIWRTARSRCGTMLRRIVQGEAVRSTYFCPTCQPARR